MVRRLLTRLIAIIPSIIVAVSVGRRGIDTLLVASQVVLSVVLPFITFPLLYLTASKDIMSVTEHRPASQTNESNVEAPSNVVTVDYSNNWIATGFGAIIWLIVVAANGYVLVSLAIGNEG